MLLVCFGIEMNHRYFLVADSSMQRSIFTMKTTLPYKFPSKRVRLVKPNETTEMGDLI